MTKTLQAVILVQLALAGCAPNVSTDTDKSGAPESCTLVAESATERVLRFSDPEIAAPGGTECKSLGGGVFDCPASFCVVVWYPGTCPQCPSGGGE
jgi:hypothetical protein